MSYHFTRKLEDGVMLEKSYAETARSIHDWLLRRGIS